MRHTARGWMFRLSMLAFVGLWARCYWIESSLYQHYVSGSVSSTKRCYVVAITVGRGRILAEMDRHTMVGQQDGFDGLMVNIREEQQRGNREIPSRRTLTIGVPGFLQDSLGVGWRKESVYYSALESSSTSIILLPMWLLLSPVIFTLCVHFWQTRKLQCRRKANQCENCGYDLRATPSHCPECGRIPRGRNERGPE